MRDRSNEEVLIGPDEVSEASEADGQREIFRERQVAGVGADEMNVRVAGRALCAAPSLGEHSGAEVDADHASPAARAQVRDRGAGAAADIQRIVDFPEDRQGALDQRVGSAKRAHVELGGKQIVAPFRR